ncbi:MAG: hypothetical protein N5P05_000333 [Chroococcopsis gigantea SAG 12.99]|jgi:DNA sulfur modification protein DndC|nr:hypothetical protein [Chroococcopsis gigantea SAG 12.99]
MVDSLSNLLARNIDDFVDNINQITEEIQELYCQDTIPLVVGWSGGKDSTTVLQLIWNAIAALPPSKRHKTIYVISNDTLVENPIVSAWVRKSLTIMQESALQQQIPLQAHLTSPNVDDTFWTCLIGKGYPAPRNRFRWCTDRLKIKPTDAFIKKVIAENGQVILALGNRKAESSNRAANMAKHEQNHRVRARLNSNPDRPNSYIYFPIEDWRTDEVWMYLMQWDNPWGVDNKKLFSMYRNATEDNECPLVVDTSTPSCGDSRFGCWVCTLVNKDKSMEAMIQNDEEKQWLQPLSDIRNELDLEDDRDRRDFRRIYGKVELYERNIEGKKEIQPIPGPYTKQWREHWLKRVLSAQEQIRKTAPDDMKDITLITPDELSKIRKIWLDEKHEFDDSLPRIYEEVTGTPFQDIRPGARNNYLLGVEEWEIIRDICGENTMHLELMTKLLDVERQYHFKLTRKGIYQSLEKCFESSSHSKEEALELAHLKRNIRNASAAGDINTLKQHLERGGDQSEKQLTWASMKFPPMAEPDH